MTDDEIDKLDDRELDARIAREVMGLPVRTLHDPCPECGGEMRFCGERAWCFQCSTWIYSPYRAYSEDIAAAWEVFEAMLRPSHRDDTVAPLTAFNRGIFKVGDDHYSAGWIWNDVSDHGRTQWYDHGMGEGDTAPLAICRAALKCVARKAKVEGR